MSASTLGVIDRPSMEHFLSYSAEDNQKKVCSLPRGKRQRNVRYAVLAESVALTCDKSLEVWMADRALTNQDDSRTHCGLAAKTSVMIA
jgi:hypothetical protein